MPLAFDARAPVRARFSVALFALAAACDSLPLYDPLGAREPLVVPVGCSSNAECGAGQVCDVGTGACLGCASDADCVTPPASVCWIFQGTCNAATATCTYLPSGEGSSCDDGNACTLDDACDGKGICRPGPARSCDDKNPCTTDACDPASGCTIAAVTDARSCGTQGEVCRGDQCQCGRGTWESSCTDGIDNDCNGKVDCADPACAAQACDDGNACTNNETCQAGACKDGQRTVCDAPRPTGCYQPVGLCSSDSGICGYRTVAANTVCDDKNPCTTNDVCDANGGCGGTKPVECKSPPGPCFEAVGTCDPSAGCVYAPRSDGTACNDANACTLGDHCDGRGACVPSTRNICGTPPGACARLAKECDPANGNCTWVPREKGSECRAADAGNPCDLPETCDGTSYECPAANAVKPDGTCCASRLACEAGACSAVASACTRPL